ncbi:APC family permease [Nocardioides sambongensis]|uniref:APC family permease n=1 Tax=Nocardioides sambongensis TaxID=2589074 RepID=UPI001127D141|nr:APC family permease [Nocardioides sambongensis]
MEPEHPRRRRRTPPALAERSVYHGLDRRSVRYGDLVAHSIAVICPSASALSTAFALPRVVGDGAWLSVLLGIGLSWLLASAFGEFAARFTATGSLYTYAAKGLGATAGLVVGCGLLLGYTALVQYGLVDASNQVGQAYVAFGGGGPPSPVVLAGFVVLAASACVGVLWRGIRWSSRFAFAAEAITLTTLAAVLGWTAVQHGLGLDRVLSLDDAAPGRVLAGAAMVMTVTIGFESCAALAVEAERPFRTVPRAMRVSVLVTGAVMLSALLVSSGVAPGERVRGRWFSDRVVSPADGLVLLVVGLSYLALAVCVWTAASRLLFAFAREGLLPARLGRTGSRTAIPGFAVLVLLPFALAQPLLLTLRGKDPGTGSYDVLVSATVILMLAYGITAAATIPFVGRLDELTPRVAATAAVGVVGTAALTWIELRDNLARGGYDVALAVLAVVLAGVAWRAALRRRTTGVARVGGHEEPLRSEVLVPAPGAGPAGPR